ncbi:HD domain-containing protein [Amycolatopsis sp. 195334CR]|uniref:HD domain-containing protein n=1 Tax=Amycolatopsis sp. 195334CR TaxID=2814588 RepID=UPI001A8DD4B1|nr:HD domain-containing protein [Amycolatopsis sp. 195334CR]MBN6037684.1 HD domain-containing protein [Amycolatopsis sp. 195334CR]
MNAVAGILGRSERYADPLWAVEFRLTPVERRLLRCRPVRRLQFVAHAGAAAVTTHQTYTRLEHSLGLLSLVAHFAPDDQAARVAALVHDLGHLPFSHTFEGVGGLDHHELGVRQIRELKPLLAEHGVDVEDVLAVEAGGPSVLRGRRGALKLDHLESFVRSGRAHARLTEPAPATLARLRLVDGEVHTDRDTAAYLAELAAGEADYLCTWENVVPNAVVRGLASILLPTHPEIPATTDDAMWSLLLADPRTRDDARLLREDPLAWDVFPPGHPDGYPYEVRHLYLDTACSDGSPAPIRETRSLPYRCVVARVRG